MKILVLTTLLLVGCCTTTKLVSNSPCNTVKNHTTYTISITGKQAHIDRLSKVAIITNKIVNSRELKAEVLNYKFSDTTDSNLVIYDKIIRGSEDFNECDDYNWDLNYKFSTDECNVYGWTYKFSNKIWLNLCNFDKNSDASLSGTICHEYAHKIGYDHSADDSYDSVPYAFGNICESLYHQFK